MPAASAETRRDGRSPSAAALRALAYAFASACPGSDAAIGFCLDSIPPGLEGTGFTAPSSYTSQASCESDGHEWCPLDDQTDDWNGIEYYWYSACCLGRQGATLVADAAGYPTCASGKAAEDCSRGEWHAKALLDLILHDDYIMDASPSLRPQPPMMSPEVEDPAQALAPCICAPDSPECDNTDATGTMCVNCRTDVPCSNDTVYLGLHVFKLHTIDLKSTHMSLAAWLRESWHDPRLTYNAQCYAGLEYFEVKAQDGALEDSRIWVPDIELYNNEEPIWAGSISGRLAMIYPCTSDGKPTTETCGNVFWSRPGLLKALCKFDGLEMFPLDSLRCKLEFAAFSVDGRYQDILPREVDGGVSWSGKEGAGFGGMTAGSHFQDYKVSSITAMRHVTLYDCCQDSPYPTLVYEVTFERAGRFYIVRLVLPAVSLALISFITFWMNPETGERLGFGITVILAMVANDVVASDMMPVADERLLMDHVSLGCQIFGWISLLETALVLFLFHHLAPSWVDAFVPTWIVGAWNWMWAPLEPVHSAVYPQIAEEAPTPKRHPSLTAFNVLGDATLSTVEQVQRLAQDLYTCKDAMVRKHLYRQIFYMVDRDFSGTLSVEEIEEFGSFMMGASWDKAKARHFMKYLDLSGDGMLELDEFSIFCEGHLDDATDTKYITKMVEGFMHVLERKRDTTVRMWRRRAHQVDTVCRWTVPPGFLIFLIILFSMDEAQMHNLMESRSFQFLVYTVCYWPLLLALLGGLVVVLPCWTAKAAPVVPFTPDARAQQERADCARKTWDVGNSFRDSGDAPGCPGGDAGPEAPGVAPRFAREYHGAPVAPPHGDGPAPETIPPPSWTPRL